MSQAVADAVRAARLPAIAVNDTFRLAPWADMLYAADSSWWSFHGAEALKFAGLKVTVQESVPHPAVLGLRHSGAEGFDDDPECLRTGGNSGYQAIHIAAHAGAKRILLCGFDMGGGHWHGDHPKPLRNTPPPTYARWIERFKTLAPELAQRGIAVVNCTPKSALRCFPMANLKDELESRAVPAA